MMLDFKAAALARISHTKPVTSVHIPAPSSAAPCGLAQRSAAMFPQSFSPPCLNLRESERSHYDFV